MTQQNRYFWMGGITAISICVLSLFWRNDLCEATLRKMFRRLLASLS